MKMVLFPWRPVVGGVLITTWIKEGTVSRDWRQSAIEFRLERTYIIRLIMASTRIIIPSQRPIQRTRLVKPDGFERNSKQTMKVARVRDHDRRFLNVAEKSNYSERTTGSLVMETGKIETIRFIAMIVWKEFTAGLVRMAVRYQPVAVQISVG